MQGCLSPFIAASGAEAGIIVGVIVGVIVIAALLSASFRVVTEYERSVFFRLGHVRPDAKGPGLIFRIPAVDRLVKVNLRVEVVDIPPQSVITKDNVTIQVDAVVYFQVVDPIQAVIGVDNFRFASQRIAMTSLRSIIGRHELDNLLAHREDVNNELRTVIAASTHHWGVEVRQVEIRDITLPPELLRAIGASGGGRERKKGQGDRSHGGTGVEHWTRRGRYQAVGVTRSTPVARSTDSRRGRDGAQFEPRLPDPHRDPRRNARPFVRTGAPDHRVTNWQAAASSAPVSLCLPPAPVRRGSPGCVPDPRRPADRRAPISELPTGQRFAHR